MKYSFHTFISWNKSKNLVELKRNPAIYWNNASMFLYFGLFVPIAFYQVYDITTLSTHNGMVDVHDLAFTSPSFGKTAMSAAVHIGYSGVIILIQGCNLRLRLKKQEFVELTNLIIAKGIFLRGT